MESGSEKYQFLVMLRGENNERTNRRKKKASEGRCAFSDEKICSWNETCRNFLCRNFPADWLQPKRVACTDVGISLAFHFLWAVGWDSDDESRFGFPRHETRGVIGFSWRVSLKFKWIHDGSETNFNLEKDFGNFWFLRSSRENLSFRFFHHEFGGLHNWKFSDLQIISFNWLWKLRRIAHKIIWSFLALSVILPLTT